MKMFVLSLLYGFIAIIWFLIARTLKQNKKLENEINTMYNNHAELDKRMKNLGITFSKDED